MTPAELENLEWFLGSMVNLPGHGGFILIPLLRTAIVQRHVNGSLVAA
jgi:hypothetical protein